jgi:hypothetical protein
VPATWHDNAFALWNDALAKAKEVEAAWPFDWVNGVDYPHKDQRGNVTGQVVLTTRRRPPPNCPISPSVWLTPTTPAPAAPLPTGPATATS